MRHPRSILYAIVSLLALVLLYAEAPGHSSTYGWAANSTVKVWIRGQANSDGTLLPVLSDFGPNIWAVLDNYSAASGSVNFVSVSSEGDADLTVNLATTSEISGSGGLACGSAEGSGPQSARHFEVRISDEAANADYFQRFFAHEIGHSFGFVDCNSCSNSAMRIGTSNSRCDGAPFSAANPSDCDAMFLEGFYLPENNGGNDGGGDGSEFCEESLQDAEGGCTPGSPILVSARVIDWS